MSTLRWYPTNDQFLNHPAVHAQNLRGKNIMNYENLQNKISEFKNKDYK
jgi:hypothetical protein